MNFCFYFCPIDSHYLLPTDMRILEVLNRTRGRLSVIVNMEKSMY